MQMCLFLKPAADASAVVFEAHHFHLKPEFGSAKLDYNKSPTLLSCLTVLSHQTYEELFILLSNFKLAVAVFTRRGFPDSSFAALRHCLGLCSNRPLQNLPQRWARGKRKTDALLDKTL